MAVSPLGPPRSPTRTESTGETAATPAAQPTSPTPATGRTDTGRLRAEAQALGLPPTATREQVEAARARQAEAVMAAVPHNPPDPASLFGLSTTGTPPASEVGETTEPDLDDWQLETKPNTTDWSKFLKDLESKDPARAGQLEQEMAALEAADPLSVFDCQRWDQLLTALGPEAGKQLDDEMFQFRFPGKERPVTEEPVPPTDPGSPVEPPPWQGEEWQLHVPPNAEEFGLLMTQLRATDPERVARYEAALARFEAAEPVSVFSERWDMLLASLPEAERQQLDDQMFQLRFPGATRPQ